MHGLKNFGHKSVFAEAFAILEAVEAHLLGKKELGIPLLLKLLRRIWWPQKFLRIGISERWNGPGLWAALALALYFLGMWFFGSLEIARADLQAYVTYGASIASVFLVAFALPSTYGNSGVSNAAVKFVVNHLEKRNFSYSAEIELLKKSVGAFEHRARSRVTMLKWLVGLLWAVFIYALTKMIESSEVPRDQLKFYMGTLFFLPAVFYAYLVVWGYEAALDKLFGAIEFGCNDFCHAMEQERRAQVGVGARDQSLSNQP